MIPETKVVYLDRFACLSSMRIGISREMAGKLIPFKVSRRATILESTEDKRVSFAWRTHGFLWPMRDILVAGLWNR